MDYQFFISYASKDLAEAQAVCALLERPGVTCWMAPDSIMPGESYVRAIPKAIRESAAVVLLFSKSADESDDVMSEITLARKYKKRIVPVRVEDDEPKSWNTTSGCGTGSTSTDCGVPTANESSSGSS